MVRARSEPPHGGTLYPGSVCRRLRDDVQEPPRRQAGAGRAGEAAWPVWAFAPSRQDALHRLPPRAPRGHGWGLQGAAVRLSRLHPQVDEMAEGQERGAPANRQEPARSRVGRDQRLVSAKPPSAVGGPAETAVREARRPLRLLRHHREHRATRSVLPADHKVVAQVAGPTNAPARPILGQLQRDPRTLPAAPPPDPPSLCRAQPSSPVKNRMREICTSGTVGGEGGNILAYPAFERKRRNARSLSSGRPKAGPGGLLRPTAAISTLRQPRPAQPVNT